MSCRPVKTRVVYLSHAFMVGGAEEMVLNLVRHLPPDKYQPMVCAIHEPGPIGREIEATGVPFRTLGRVPGLGDPCVQPVEPALELTPDVIRLIHVSAATVAWFWKVEILAILRLSGAPAVFWNRARRHVGAHGPRMPWMPTLILVGLPIEVEAHVTFDLVHE